MAWEIKYQGSFYNIKDIEIIVNIYEDDYDGEIIPLTLTDVVIEVTYEGDDIPVMGMGATVKFINKGSFNDYNDLLTNYERQFRCEIAGSEGSNPYFDGFLICDLNEQQMNQYSEISLRFTNYLKRLKGAYLESFNISEKSPVMNIIGDILDFAGFGDYHFFINSTLFHDGMDDGNLDCFLDQVYVAHDVFYKNPQEIDDGYTILNKLLTSFHTFIYSYYGYWYIERYEDIGRDGDWVRFVRNSDGSWSGDSRGSQRQQLNKQSDEIKYIGADQRLLYDSGAKKIIINMLTEEFDTLVYNDFPETINTTSPYQSLPDPEDLEYQTWYMYENNVGYTQGYNRGHIKRYMFAALPESVDPQDNSLYKTCGFSYKFKLQFNEVETTRLEISYKQRVPAPRRGITIVPRWNKITARFMVRIGDEYLYEDEDELIQLGTYAELGEDVEFTFEFTDINFYEGEITINKKLNLDNIAGSSYGLNRIEDFTIYFLPCLTGNSNYYYMGSIGDFKVTVNPDVLDNEITAELNENFVKTKEVTHSLSDIDNIHYRNGLEVLEFGDYIRTSDWYSSGESATESLIDKYIKSQFKRLGKTTRKISAKIQYDGYIKPFTIYTDNNIVDDSQNVIKFIITRYRLDLRRAEYEIEAEEYSDEDITINE